MRTDDMVREALADLAPTAPADNTALAGMHRAIGRRRRRQQVARIAAAVAFVALAVGTTAVVLDAESDPSQVSTDPDDTTTPTTTPSTPTTTATTPETTEARPAETDRITFGPVSFQLPEGWVEVYREPRSSPFAEGEGEAMCIAPAGNEGLRWEDCSGLLIQQGDFLQGNEQAPYEPHAPWAWYHATDAAPCPTGPAGNQDYIQAPDGMGPIDQGFRSVGDRTASYDRWRAVCPQSGFTFEPEAWFLPESRVVVFDVFGHDETEAFLASFEFDS